MKETRVQPNYKDTMFRMLFKEKENALDLYNALNKTAYTDADKLEITTLENAIYLNYKNDISFVFGYELMLYEHQSTVNRNMPLRDLIYVTEVLQGRIEKADLYDRAIIKLPTPRFVVFYNGIEPQPEEQTLRLSDAFEKKLEEPELELVVKVYNVNLGYNPELMNACSLLKEYAQYVEQVRERTAKDIPFVEAVEQAVDYCIQNRILADFLSKNRAEAIAMCIYEYNEELHLKNEYKRGLEEGNLERIRLEEQLVQKEEQLIKKDEQIAKQKQQFEQQILTLIDKCKSEGDDVERTVRLIRDVFSLDQCEAEERVKRYWQKVQ